jgi:hypothetical protein
MKIKQEQIELTEKDYFAETVRKFSDKELSVFSTGPRRLSEFPPMARRSASAKAAVRSVCHVI